MNTQTEAIAQVDARLSAAGLDTYTDVLNELRNVMDAVRAGVPETGGYGEIGRPAFAHGWNAAIGARFFTAGLAAAHALLRQVGRRGSTTRRPPNPDRSPAMRKEYDLQTDVLATMSRPTPVTSKHADLLTAFATRNRVFAARGT
ncbi:hypothetical protein Y036_6230 [Burkholderia pseudomallei]|uniref:Uncharacterized protein n=1 Tax=Burkholderia pseudomallei TaxID=28450 RepID=A0AA40JJN7_BURPE|nr:hypothetical protein [Burkholderia pseudomallei]KGX17222.1 hypothetical protein Y036_6230 [Burkholderia pseudomallei]